MVDTMINVYETARKNLAYVTNMFKHNNSFSNLPKRIWVPQRKNMLSFGYGSFSLRVDFLQPEDSLRSHRIAFQPRHHDYLAIRKIQ